MRPLVLFSVAALAGCLGPVKEIPCESDDTCPTGYWCDQDGTCTLTADSTPPLLELDGVKVKETDTLGKSISLPRSDFSEFIVQIGNYGQAQAAYPTVTLEAPCLTGLGDIGSNLIGVLDGSDHAEATADIDPAPSCPSPTTVTVHLSIAYGSASNNFVRTFPDGQFTIVLTP